MTYWRNVYVGFGKHWVGDGKHRNRRVADKTADALRGIGVRLAYRIKVRLKRTAA